MQTTRQRLKGLPLVAGAASALMLALAVGTPAFARSAPRVRKLLPMFPTTAGAQLRLKGKVRTETQPSRSREKVNVEVESSSLSSGAKVDVYAINPTASTQPVFLGTITLQSR